MSYFYKYCGKVVESSFPFPELEAEPGSASDFRIFLDTKSIYVDSVDWFHSWDSNPRVSAVSFGRMGSKYVVSVEGTGNFELDPEASTICCMSVAESSETLFRHIVLHQVLPVMLSIDNSLLVLHASAVEIDGEAVAFVGPAGAGKSTMAAKLCKQGNALISDDVLVVSFESGQPFVVPSFPSIRLWPDSVEKVLGSDRIQELNTKQRLSARDFGSFSSKEKLPLKRIFLLSELEKGEGAQLTTGQALMELGCHSFRLEFGGDREKSEEFEMLVELVSSTSVELSANSMSRSH